MSKPILNLLARASAEVDLAGPTESVTALPLKVTDVPSAQTSTNITPVACEYAVPPAPGPRRASAGAAVLTMGCVVAASALAGFFWLGSHRPQSLLPAPTITSASAPVAARAPSLTPAATESPPTPAARSEKVLVSELLATDGSEATTPTCDALLVDVPLESDRAWSDDHVRTARRALVRGDVAGSQRAFCQAIRAIEGRAANKTPPSVLAQLDAAVSLELAQLLLLRRDAVSAMHWAQRAQRLDARSTHALWSLGDALVRSGNVDDARKSWLAAANLSPSDRVGVGRMVQRTLDAAVGSLKERDPARAERLLRRVMAFQPDNDEAREKLSAALTLLGFPKSAESWLRATPYNR